MNSLSPPDEITEAFLITKKFQTSEEFSKHIQENAVRRDIRYLEALLEYCENYDIDPVAAAGLVDAPLKAMIQVEAENLHLLKPILKRGKLK